MTKRGKQVSGGADRHTGRQDRAVLEPRPQRPVEGRRGAPRERQPVERHGGQGGGLVYMLVPAIVVVGLGLGGLWYIGGNKGATAPSEPAQPPPNQTAAALSDVVWPSYVARGPQGVKDAYQFAVLRPDVLDYMPCYCGCGEHNGHRSNRECFIANMNQGGRTIAFDQHGST